MNLRTRTGITLMELIAILVVAGLAIPALMSLWAQLSWSSVRSEGLGDAALYTQQLMEEIQAKRFDQNTTSPWTSTASLGPDTARGESAGNKATFNDTDDFNAYVDYPARNYNRTVSVGYVNLSSSGAWVACPTVTCTAVTDCIACSQCCYKRVTVTTRRTDKLPVSTNLTTVVSGYR